MRCVIFALSLASTAALAHPHGEPLWPKVRAAFARSWIGVEAQAMTPELRAYFGAPGERGILVADVVENSPAAKAGVRAGDVIVRAGGKEVRGVGDLLEIVADAEPGATLTLELVRERKQTKADVKVARNPDFEFEGAVDQLRKGRDKALEELKVQLDRLEKKVDELQRELRKP